MTVPAQMTGIEITAFGGPEVLEPAQVPVPAPGAGEVLVKVAAAGVNRPDCLQRAGLYPLPPDASPLPGLEIAARWWPWARAPHAGRSVTGWSR